MHRLYILLIAYICCTGICKAQNYFDTLNTLHKKQRAVVAERIFTSRIEHADSTIALPALNKLYDMANRLDDAELQAKALGFLGRYYDDHALKFKPKAIAYILQALDVAQQNGLKEYEAELNDRLGHMYYDLEKYSLAFEYLIKARDIVKDVGYDKFPDVDRYLYDIGVTYLDFEDYDNSLIYLNESIRHPFTNLWYAVQIYNTLGLVYRQLGKYDTALAYFNKALEAAKEKKDSACIGFVIGNIGSIYYLQEQYDKALPFFRIDYRLSFRHKQWLSATKDLLTLADINFKHNHIDSAEQQVLQARQLSHVYTTVKTSMDVYQSLARLYHVKNDFIHSYIYLDSFLILKDSLSKKTDTKMYSRIEDRLELQKHQSELQLLHIEKSKELVLRDAIIIAFILITAIAAQSIFRMRFQHKKNSEIYLLAKEKNESEIKRAEEELHNAEKLLASYLENLRDKNQLIEQFKDEIKILQTKPNSPLQIEKTETLEKLLNTTILTDDDWNKFKKLFEKAHDNFFIKLKMKFPALTQAETRLLALTKLNLNTKEMAAMLGISPDSIRKSRYRLCKKLNLPEETGLKDIVANL